MLPHWTWPERVGQKVPVFVYTNGDCAELFVNGVSQGMQCKSPKADSSTLRFRLMWPDVVYEAGRLEVVAYRAGEELGRKRLQTASRAHTLRVTPDRRTLQADGMDLAYLQLDMVDEAGTLVPGADHFLSLSVKGPATLAGVGNGNQQSLHPFHGDTVPLFYGQAMVILRMTGEPGEIRLNARAKGMKAVEVRLRAE
ncbi:MAG: DUF4982 domain-containing protein [Bacteroidetes bacterium]|nr:MAG: DUF4982 domain-containing protein [Bacteroidota bacterium]